MYRRARMCAAVLLAAAVMFSGVWLSSGSSRADEDEEEHAIIFSGRDFWRDGAFVYGGLLVAPGGLDQDGFMLKLLLSGGLYRYLSFSIGGETVVGTEGRFQALPGFRIKRADAEMKFFFGPEWQQHRLYPDDPDNPLRGRSFGLRIASEVWYEPTPRNLISGDISLSSIATSQSARLDLGWRAADDIFNGNGFYVGPEIQYIGAEGYRHLRLGLHVTSLKTETTEWSAAFGWAQDSDGRSSPYVRLNLSSRR